jgi:hemerythrin
MLDNKPIPGKMVWTPALEIGIPIIDEQHVTLCELANRLLDYPGALARDELIVDILSDLGKFLILHFKTEEALMKKLGMPKDEIEKHKQAHNTIVAEYADLNLDAVRGVHHTAAEIFGQVKLWVGDHLETVDLQIRNYVPATTEAGDASVSLAS